MKVLPVYSRQYRVAAAAGAQGAEGASLVPGDEAERQQHECASQSQRLRSFCPSFSCQTLCVGMGWIASSGHFRVLPSPGPGQCPAFCASVCVRMSGISWQHEHLAREMTGAGVIGPGLFPEAL